MESFREISFWRTRSLNERFNETMPSLEDVSITAGISCVLFSRMRLLMALLQIITSQTGINPPFTRGTRRWETTAKSEPANWKRIWFCCSEGNTSMIRWIDWEAELVCRVANTKWPVSAAVMAGGMG